MSRLAFLLIFLSACKPSQGPDHGDQSLQEILSADRDMSTLASKTGFHAALLAFADDSLVKPEEGKLPVIGKKALEELWAGDSGTKDISWEPIKAEASKSGDLGYTFGNWKLVRPDTVYYGNYFTAWKKNTDGKWKWTVDGGNNTPAPK